MGDISLRRKKRVKVVVINMPGQKPVKSWTIYGVDYKKVLDKLIKASEEVARGDE